MKKKIAILGNSWSFDFVNSIITGIQETIENFHEKADVYFFTCYKFHNPDKSDNITGYNIFDLINFEDYDGVVLLSNLFEDKSSLEKVVSRIKKSKIPAVAVINQVPGLPFITCDNYPGFHDLICHLIEKHNVKNIAYIGGIEGDEQNTARYQAFIDAMNEHNLKINKDIVIKNSDWSFNCGFELGNQFFKMETIPDAVVCSNDNEAQGVLKAALINGIKVPEQVKIIGCDNSDRSEQTIPSLSTVDTQIKQIGIEAAKVLLKGKMPAEPIVVKSAMCIRQSCGCEFGITEKQKNYAIFSLSIRDSEERFTAQLRHTEDVLINDNNIQNLWEECQQFFVKRHDFEGTDFAILLKKEFVNSILYNDEDKLETENKDLLQVLVNLHNGKLVSPEEITQHQLIPSNMLDDNNNLYIFLPLVFHKNFYGFYCGKNNKKLIYKSHGYSWTKNVANSIEKIREKNKYRVLSQKYLGLSTKDALSQAYNRTALEMFGKELYEINRHSDYFTVIYFIDINYMKIINDKHGHLHGDMAIKLVAEELQSKITEKWLLIRYGGDEFVILGTSKKADFKDILKGVNAGLLERGKNLSLPYKVTVSIGFGLVPPDSVRSLDDEINAVDKIMYENKQKYHDKKNELSKN